MLVKTAKGAPAEIYSSGVKMFLVHEEKNLHTPVYCKDFITDVFWSCHRRKAGKPFWVSLYSFEYRKKIDLLSMNNFQLFIYLKNTDLSLKGEMLQNFLNEAEIRINIPYSQVTPTNADGENGLLITFDKEWTIKPYLLSLFLLFCRVGLVYNNEDFYDFIDDVIKTRKTIHYSNNNDAGYLRRARNLIDKIFKEQEQFKQEWLDYVDVHSVHNDSGIASLGDVINQIQ